MEKVKLTVKQENFCEKYIETGNASEAYRYAFNCEKASPESINVNACKLLKSTKVVLRIEQKQKALREKSDISKEDILIQLKAIAFSDIRDYLNFNGKTIQFKNFKNLTDQQAKAIECIKRGKNGIELKLHGKSWTIERICKMLGYDAPTKNEVTGKDGKPLYPRDNLDLSKLNDEELNQFRLLHEKAAATDPEIEEQKYKWH